MMGRTGSCLHRAVLGTERRGLGSQLSGLSYHWNTCQSQKPSLGLMWSDITVPK